MKLSSKIPNEKYKRRILDMGEDVVVVFTKEGIIEGGGIGASKWYKKRRKGYGI